MFRNAVLSVGFTHDPFRRHLYGDVRMCSLQPKHVHWCSTMQDYIELVTDGQDLTISQAREAASAVFDGATEAQIGALLAGLRAKGETEAEIAGLRAGNARRRRGPSTPDRTPLVDTCGTGGDDYNTINVSTTSAIVASGRGRPGRETRQLLGLFLLGKRRRARRSRRRRGLRTAGVERAIEETGNRLHARARVPPRDEGRHRPAEGTRHAHRLQRPRPADEPRGGGRAGRRRLRPRPRPVLARALSHMDVAHALVVHGSGMDEIAVHDETTVAEVENGTIEEYTLSPADLGVGEHAPCRRRRGRLAVRKRGGPPRNRRGRPSTARSGTSYWRTPGRRFTSPGKPIRSSTASNRPGTPSTREARASNWPP